MWNYDRHSVVEPTGIGVTRSHGRDTPGRTRAGRGGLPCRATSMWSENLPAVLAVGSGLTTSRLTTLTGCVWPGWSALPPQHFFGQALDRATASAKVSQMGRRAVYSAVCRGTVCQHHHGALDRLTILTKGIGGWSVDAQLRPVQRAPSLKVGFPPPFPWSSLPYPEPSVFVNSTQVPGAIPATGLTTLTRVTESWPGRSRWSC